MKNFTIQYFDNFGIERIINVWANSFQDAVRIAGAPKDAIEISIGDETKTYELFYSIPVTAQKK
jgi:hypothetical protein